MNRTILLPSAYLLDHLAGDPEWFPHPVRIMGNAISNGEALIRRPGQSPAFELFSGAGLTLFVVGSSYFVTAKMIRFMSHRSAFLGRATELVLAWTCLAARSLDDEARAVTNALDAGDLPHARARLARIVGRDTETLDDSEVSRAVIETVAESASDGIMAPLFYMALGGVPLAMSYKAINTLDSMIGHADENHFYFGKCAARLDDVANYLPSRISALTIVAAAALARYSDPQAALKIWRRDGEKHKSPNAGQPESAMAGALHVALGGHNTYAGEPISAQRMGEEFPPPTNLKAKQAIRLVSTASLIGLGMGIVLTGLLQTRRRSSHE